MRLLSALLMFLSASLPARADWTLDFVKDPIALPGGAEFSEREATFGDRTVRLHAVFFTEKSHALRVLDNAAANQGRLADAMTTGPFTAGINGGYFHADWRPVGLAIADGTTSNGFERAKLLSGVFVVTDGKPRLDRSSAYKPSKNDTHALQAGPFLIDERQATVGLNNTRRARRSVIATDGKGRWALLSISPLTLADAAALLASPTVFPDFRPTRALNLDGGSSSALWAATPGKPYSLREIGSVRNYLAITPK